MTKPLALISAVAFLGCILAANYVTSEYGMVWVFGLTATAGTYFAGASFALRDSLQDLAGRRASVAVIIAGGLLSFLVADPFIALASALAFVAAELADFAVYTPLRKRGYIRAAVASNIVGSVVDTIIFLYVAQFGLAGEVIAGQVLGKLAVTGLVILAVAGVRARRVSA